jgi:hypothetical protein
VAKQVLKEDEPVVNAVRFSDDSAKDDFLRHIFLAKDVMPTFLVNVFPSGQSAYE